MPTAVQPKTLGDLLKYEAPSYYSRDEAVVAAGQNLALGTVLGQNSSDGKLYALNPNAIDGTQNAVAVLAQDVDASAADATALIVARHAIVARGALVWPSGITDAQKAAAEGQLKGLGILVRDSA